MENKFHLKKAISKTVSNLGKDGGKWGKFNSIFHQKIFFQVFFQAPFICSSTLLKIH
jgi:hypothetical protein